MKHLKTYESIQNDENIKQDLEDICLELQDDGYTTQVRLIDAKQLPWLKYDPEKAFKIQIMKWVGPGVNPPGEGNLKKLSTMVMCQSAWITRIRTFDWRQEILKKNLEFLDDQVAEVIDRIMDYMKQKGMEEVFLGILKDEVHLRFNRTPDKEFV